MISEQWFVTIDPLAKAALDAVKDGRIKIVPEHFEKTYYNWMENIKDWCISRQLWWGHRIPVWYCPDGHMTVVRETPTQCATCSSKEIHQDEDVLDTWFSSGLWPFSTLGWPEQTPDLKYFYPTSYMETGYDILFFWVARMIMMGLEFTSEAPFHTVYLHGLVRDEHGQKMSKTKGNVIDPLIVMDEFGTDALRFTLLVGSTPGNDTNVGVKKVEANRNFANKIWNAGRFVINAIDSLSSASTKAKGEYSTLADLWIWARLQNLIRDVERLFQTFQYGEAGRQIYEFIWGDFADWYVEIAKGQLAEGGARARLTTEILARVFDTSLRLLHPFTPFVTEEVWGHLHSALRESALKDICKDWPDALIVAKWPEPRKAEGWEESKLVDFMLIQEIVRAIRNFWAEQNILPADRTQAVIGAGEKSYLLKAQTLVICALTGLDAARFQIEETLYEKTRHRMAQVVGPVEIHLPLAGMIDQEAARRQLSKELANTESQIDRLAKLLASDFANKAPGPVVAKEREKLEGYKETAKKLKAQLK